MAPVRWINRGKYIPNMRSDYITLQFHSNGDFRGFSGCNHYGGSYTLSGQNGISFEGFMTTLMYCMPEPLMDQEWSYLGLLINVSFFEMTADGMLNLKDDAGTVILVYYERENPADSAGVPAPHVVRKGEAT
jgi:heat shock protein HslJ